MKRGGRDSNPQPPDRDSGDAHGNRTSHDRKRPSEVTKSVRPGEGPVRGVSGLGQHARDDTTRRALDIGARNPVVDPKPERLLPPASRSRRGTRSGCCALEWHRTRHRDHPSDRYPDDALAGPAGLGRGASIAACLLRFGGDNGERSRRSLCPAGANLAMRHLVAILSPSMLFRCVLLHMRDQRRSG